MLSLPETLLLFAVHDSRGSVHASAFLGIDEALTAATLGELMLRGMIQVRPDGAVRLLDDPPDSDSVLLLLANKALLEGNSDTVDATFTDLEKRLGGIRTRIVNALAAKGILRADEVDREGLADSEVHPSANATPEAEMLAHLREGIRKGPDVSRRIGLLIGLVHVLDLWGVLLPKKEHEAARKAGEWVLERDAICSAARVAVKKADGSWEG